MDLLKDIDKQLLDEETFRYESLLRIQQVLDSVRPLRYDLLPRHTFYVDGKNRARFAYQSKLHDVVIDNSLYFKMFRIVDFYAVEHYKELRELHIDKKVEQDVQHSIRKMFENFLKVTVYGFETIPMKQYIHSEMKTAIWDLYKRHPSYLQTTDSSRITLL